MLNAQFAINARPETVTQDFRLILRPWGYLVPPGGLTRELTTILTALSMDGEPLVVDNGLYNDIGRISTELAKPIASARAELGMATCQDGPSASGRLCTPW